MTELYIRNVDINLSYVENKDNLEEILLKIIIMNDIRTFPTQIKNDVEFQAIMKKLTHKAFNFVEIDNLLIANKENYTLNLVNMMTKDIDYPKLINMLYNIC